MMRYFSRPVATSLLAGLIAFAAVNFMASPLQAEQISKNISGSFGIAENACVLPIATFVGKNCTYSGAVLIPADLGAVGSEIGPLNSGGFYASAAAAPGFTLSTQTGLADDGTPLTSFLVGVPASPDDGKISPAFAGEITIDDGGDGFGDTTDTIAGSFVMGPGARLVSAGNSLAGSKTIIEQWTSVTHTLTPTTVDSATPNLTTGGTDYVLGSAGFPDLLCTGTGSGGIGDCFASEKAAVAGFLGDGTATRQPWRQEQGGTLLTVPNTPDITRYGVTFTGPGPNVGGNTTAVINGLTCFDTGLDPKEPGSPADTITDCGDSSVAWGTFGVFPNDAGGTPGGPKLNAGTDNLVLKLTTDAAGNIVAADAYYTMEYSIISPGDNSMVGGTLSFTGSPDSPGGAMEIDITGSQSTVDGACVAPTAFFSGLDCTYNNSSPWLGVPTSAWQGPSNPATGYYQVGQSPFVQGAVGDEPVVGDTKYSVPILTGSVIRIDDKDSACTADDQISGSISLGAATRAFSGGPGSRGEETWADGDILYPIPATTVTAATANGAGGCDYEIASAGFPPLLVSEKGGNYIFDATIVPSPPLPDQDSWTAPAAVGMGCSLTSNCGVGVGVTVAAGWSCTDNTGGTGACATNGSHYRGTRGTLENFLISISTNGSGDITAGTIFANNEQNVAVNILPDPNSWDGAVLTFTGTCNNCKLASDDKYTLLEGAGTTTLDIGANDSSALVDPTTIIITSPPPVGMVSNVSAPGFIKDMTVDYTPPAGTGTEQFEYSVNDGVNLPAMATVTVMVEPNSVPIANDIDRTLNTQGVAPSTLSDSFNALTEDGNMPGDDGVVTTGNANLGTASTNGTNVTYRPGATFFSGTDSFTYTITDKHDDSDSGTVTITIPDVVPIANDAAATTDRWVPVVIPISYTVGNGSLAQHSVVASATNGACTVNLFTSLADYAPVDGFFGQDTCAYTITDGDGSSADGVITVTVNFVEDLIPVAVEDQAETLQDQSIDIDVLANDSLGNPPNSVTIETAPGHGSAAVQPDNRIRYFPSYMFFGPDTFEYRITDFNGDTDVAIVTVNVLFVSGRVPIDIVPGKEINNVNLQAGGRIQVAILSVGEFFDAPATVDPFSLKFGPREANIIGTPSVRDIDHDGDDDLLVKFLIEQTGIPCGAPATNLIGGTFFGGFIFGDDSINTFQCRRRPITY